MKTLDSGLAVIPDPDPGRNDGKRCFLTFYEILNIDGLVKSYVMPLCGTVTENN